MQSWKESPFGQVITFCDNQTLQRVRDTWKLYTTEGLTDSGKSDRLQEISGGIERARDLRKKYFGTGSTLGGIRSAAPVSFSAIAELPRLHDIFWTKVDLDPKAKALQPNPTFFMSHDRVVPLHYGTDPLLGFHLATAFAPLTTKSPLRTSPHIPSHLSNAVKAAQTEFFAWIDAFANSPKQKLRIHCFAGDALAFSHTLQDIHMHSEQTTGHWHRDSWSFEALELDAAQCGGLQTNPTLFSVIDVSNLTDHLGSLNVIIAFAPLLVKSSNSTLYTEILVSSKAGSDERMRNFLCGDFSSVSLLLGPANVEAWTNTTCISDVEEGALAVILKEINLGSARDSTQIRTRLCWRRLDQVAVEDLNLSMDPSDLAAIMMKVHRGMFRHEDILTLMGDMKKHGVDKISNPYYNRASFVALLKYVKRQMKTDWAISCKELLGQIENDKSSMIGMNSYQELCLHLHLQGVFSVNTLSYNPTKFMKVDAPKRFVKAESLPNVLAITVQVPSKAIQYIGSVPIGELGIPSLCCTMQNTRLASQSWSNMFSVVQAGFGTVEQPKYGTGPVPVPDSFSVKASKADWTGRTPLVVSFYVPTWMLLQARTGTMVTVGFQTNPYAAAKHMAKLGPGLALYSADLEDEASVFISRFLPNARDVPSASALSISDSSSGPTSMQLQATVNDTGTKIDRLVAKISVSGDPAKDLADKESRVVISQISPTTIVMTIGRQKPSHIVFPRPVSSSRSKLRIARKSSYVEILAPFMLPLDEDFPQEHTFPLSVRQGSEASIVCWHMHYVNFNAFPQLDFDAGTSPEWMNTHTSLMFSGRERVAKNAGMTTALSTEPSARSRVDFKDGLFTIFGHIAGLSGPIAQTQKAHAFRLHRKGAGGVQVLIFVSKPLLDLANRTVILDTAILVSTHDLVNVPLFQKSSILCKQVGSSV